MDLGSSWVMTSSATTQSYNSPEWGGTYNRSLEFQSLQRPHGHAIAISLLTSYKQNQWESQQEIKSCDHVRFLLNLSDPHLTMVTGTARIAVAKQQHNLHPHHLVTEFPVQLQLLTEDYLYNEILCIQNTLEDNLY